jgi:hypothetical protein
MGTDPKKHLTETDSIRTIVQNTEREDVDATARKLVERLRQLERDQWRINSELRSIRMALDVAGVRPSYKFKELADPRESEYVRSEPFKKNTLAETCYTILRDFKPEWLTKSQVEYLAIRGGYNFSTTDSKNSIDVTLRRMAGAGKIEADKVRGSRGSKYRFIPEPIEVEQEAKAQ